MDGGCLDRFHFDFSPRYWLYRLFFTRFIQPLYLGCLAFVDDQRGLGYSVGPPLAAEVG